MAKVASATLFFISIRHLSLPFSQRFSSRFTCTSPLFQGRAHFRYFPPYLAKTFSPQSIRCFSSFSAPMQRSENDLVRDVLTFWFGTDEFTPFESYKHRTKMWYVASKQFDDQIRQKFGRYVDAALVGELDHFIGNTSCTWKADLALIIMLDQFARNIYRGSAKAFSGDAKTKSIVNAMIEKDQWKHLKHNFSPSARMSFLLPLMHQEALQDQDRCIELIQGMIEECKVAGDEAKESQSVMQTALGFAQEHREIIARFGRFPHRNKAFGRESSIEEVMFLKDALTYGQ